MTKKTIKLITSADGTVAKGTPMSDEEDALLAECEATINRGLGTFIEVGNALRVIRDRLLYREHGDTFEDYVRDRFDLSRRYAYYQINAASVGGVLCTIVHIPPPIRESQVRPLVTLASDEDKIEAWKIAVETAPRNGDGERVVTADHVEQTVERLYPKPPKTDDELLEQARKRGETSMGVVIRSCDELGFYDQFRPVLDDLLVMFEKPEG